MMEYEYLFTDRKRIGGNIKAIMKDRKCTKVTLSQAINMSRPTLDAFLNGDINNATKYNEYIKRLLAYMQINESVLDNYKSLPDIKKMRCNNVDKELVKAELEGARIPVISEGDIIDKSKAIMESGTNVFAISATNKDSIKCIAQLTEEYPDAIIGIVDVLTKEQASLAVDSGAKFVVAIGELEEIGIFAKARDVYCMMISATVLESNKVISLGADGICLYPIDSVDKYTVETIKRVLPDSTLAAYACNTRALDMLNGMFYTELYLYNK